MIRKLGRLLKLFIVGGLVLGTIIKFKFEELYLKSQLSSLKRILDREMGKERSLRIVSAVRKHHEEIARRRPPTEKGVMRFHRENAIMCIAFYRALKEELDEEEDLVERTHRIMWISGMQGITKLLCYFLGRSQDPFKLFMPGVVFSNRYIFPSPPWETTDVEVDGGVGFDYTKCPYYEFLKEEGVPELTVAFCELDWRMAELFPPQIEMQRTGTLGTGAEKCDFRYYRR